MAEVPAHWSFETKQVHAGQVVDRETNARALPIYQTTSFVFRDAQHGADLFSLAEPGNIYTRIINPTVATVEERVAALEGGVAGLFFASGQAATTAAILNVAQAGDHIVVSPRLYGGTHTLLSHTLPKYGIEISFVENPDDPHSWAAAVKDRTRAFFAETISNPINDVLDIPAVAEIAHAHAVPLIVDNTVATPYLIRPLEFGADIVINSATKFLSGHGTTISGVLVDGGKFDWTQERNGAPAHPSFVTADPSYHGLVYAELGPPAFALKARVTLLRDTGAAPSPFDAWLVNQGVETLSLRVERHNANAQTVAEFLEQHPQVEAVAYPGLASSPWHHTLEKLGAAGGGSIVAFEIKGGKDAAWAFLNALSLHSQLVNIGDVKSLAVHPSTTTHSQLTAEQQKEAGVTPATVRLSVGIEGINDILSDLAQGFAAAE